MKTKIMFVLGLFLCFSMSSCIFSESDGLVENSEMNFYIQDIKFKIDEGAGDLKIAFFIKAYGGSIKNAIPINISLLDEDFKETGIKKPIILNEPKIEYKVGEVLQEQITIPMTEKVLLGGGTFYIDFTMNDLLIERVKYVYTKTTIPDWEDGGTISTAKQNRNLTTNN